MLDILLLFAKFFAFVIIIGFFSLVKKILSRGLKSGYLFSLTKTHFLYAYSPIDILLKMRHKKESRPLDIKQFVFYFTAYSILLLIFSVIPISNSIILGGRNIFFELIQFQDAVYIMIVLLALLFLVELANSSKGLRLNTMHKPSLILITIFSLFALAYDYGTLNLHEIVQVQKSHGLTLIPEYGLLRNPIIFLIYIYALAATMKSLKVSNGDLTEDLSMTETFLRFFYERSLLFILYLIGAFLFLGGYAPLLGVDIIAIQYPVVVFFINAFSLLIKVEIIKQLAWMMESFAVAKGARLQLDELYYYILPAFVVMMAVGALFRLVSL